jgi:hypothetical protein
MWERQGIRELNWKGMNKWGVKTKKNEKNSSTLGRREGLTTKKK